MNDNLISRAAAIDALKEAFNPSITNFVKAKMAIDNLPPAQSEVRTQMSSADCISRQSAIDRINKQREHLRPDIYEQDYIGDAAYRICAEFIERLPSAQPEIVTCKDCRWRKDQSGSTAWLPCRAIVTPPDFYCVRAERRTDEGD